MIPDATHPGVALPNDPIELPGAVSEALEQLRQAGVGGPYGVALGPAAYASLSRTVGAGGYPVMKHVSQLIDRPVVWAPSLRGGIAVSLRGGDFKLICGRDTSIGYLSHDDKVVCLYLEESFSAELSGPEAVVPLLPVDDTDALHTADDPVGDSPASSAKPRQRHTQSTLRNPAARIQSS